MKQRLAVLLVLVMAAMSLLAIPAMAEGFVVSSPAFTVANSTPVPGSSQLMSMSGFAASSAVDIRQRALGSTDAGASLVGTKSASQRMTNASGAFSDTMTMPLLLPYGVRELIATAGNDIKVITVTVTQKVVASSTAGSAGSALKVSGYGWKVGQVVTASLDAASGVCSEDNVLGTATVNANGAVQIQSVVPEVTAGTYYVNMLGDDAVCKVAP